MKKPIDDPRHLVRELAADNFETPDLSPADPGNVPAGGAAE